MEATGQRGLNRWSRRASVAARFGRRGEAVRGEPAGISTKRASRPRASGDRVVESRPGKKCQRGVLVAVSTPRAHPAHSSRLAVGGRGEAELTLAAPRLGYGGSWRGCSGPALSRALQAVLRVPVKGSVHEGQGARRTPAGQAHLFIFVSFACHDLPIYFPLWIGFFFLQQEAPKCFFHIF